MYRIKNFIRNNLPDNFTVLIELLIIVVIAILAEFTIIGGKII